VLNETVAICEKTFGLESSGLSRAEAKRKTKVNSSTYYTWLRANQPGALRRQVGGVKKGYHRRQKAPAVISFPITEASIQLTVKDLASFAKELLRA
jgi:hypothetical protein